MNGAKLTFKKDTKKELKKLAKAKGEYSPTIYFPEVNIIALGVTRSKKVLKSKIIRVTERFDEFPNRRRIIDRITDITR